MTNWTPRQYFDSFQKSCDSSSIFRIKMPCRRLLPAFLCFVFVFMTPSSTDGQPFLNSLAVLFRARPPWPTTFPSAKFPPIPSPLISSSGSQHGILVAHPLNPSPAYDPMNKNTNSNNNNINGPPNDDSKSRKPDLVGSPHSPHPSHPQPPVPSPQQNFVPIPSMPTLSPLLPLFPPPNIGMFQNNHVLGAGHSRVPHPGGNNNNPHHHHHKGNHPLPNQVPMLVSSPTSIVGNYVFPEAQSTVANPNYGVLLENHYSKGNSNNNNNHHHHHHNPNHNKKQKPDFRGNNAWNPLLTPVNQNSHHVQAVSSNNNNNQHVQDNRNQNQNQNKPFQPSHGHPHPNNLLTNSNINTNANGNSNGNNNSSYGVRNERQRKQKKMKDFRPSPQLNSYVETTVISDYASHVQANNGDDLRNIYNQSHHTNSNSKEQNSDKLSSSFSASEATTYPKFESGFRPISLNQYASDFGTTATRPHYTNSKQQYFNPWSIAFDPAQSGSTNNQTHYHGQGHNANSIHDVDEQHRNSHSRGEKPFRQDRQILTGTVSQPVISAAADGHADDGSSSEEDDPLVFFGNRGRKKSSEGKSRHRFSSKGKKHRGVSATLSSTTASSELVEEWLPPGVQIEKKSDTNNNRKFPIFNKKPPPSRPLSSGPRGMAKLPDKCNKFHRFGFCPVTRQYPLDAAEAIASRCSALLSHLIAPLPKMDVQYDIAAEGKNGTTGKGRSSGWSWRSYQGKPVCDTDEITTVPGWAKNENGEWMIILQTKIWQQKAHISLCSPSATHCQGLACSSQTNGNDNGSGQTSPSNEKNNGGSEIRYTKCVQRFTAQRLAVFDPENSDRCPVVRSVFLPSACVCLTSTGNPNGTGPNSNSNSVEKDSQSTQTFSGRQPLFSTNEEGVHYAASSGISPYPVDSVEALLTAKQSQGRTREGKASKGNLSQGESRSIEAKKSHQLANESSQSLPISNATFMIITEKFTTNESSKETTDLLSGSGSGSGSTEILNGTQNASQVSN